MKLIKKNNQFIFFLILFLSLCRIEASSNKLSKDLNGTSKATSAPPVSLSREKSAPNPLNVTSRRQEERKLTKNEEQEFWSQDLFELKRQSHARIYSRYRSRDDGKDYSLRNAATPQPVRQAASVTNRSSSVDIQKPIPSCGNFVCASEFGGVFNLNEFQRYYANDSLSKVKRQIELDEASERILTIKYRPWVFEQRSYSVPPTPLGRGRNPLTDVFVVGNFPEEFSSASRGNSPQPETDQRQKEVLYVVDLEPPIAASDGSARPRLKNTASEMGIPTDSERKVSTLLGRGGDSITGVSARQSCPKEFSPLSRGISPELGNLPPPGTYQKHDSVCIEEVLTAVAKRNGSELPLEKKTYTSIAMQTGFEEDELLQKNLKEMTFLEHLIELKDDIVLHKKKCFAFVFIPIIFGIAMKLYVNELNRDIPKTKKEHVRAYLKKTKELIFQALKHPRESFRRYPKFTVAVWTVLMTEAALVTNAVL